MCSPVQLWTWHIPIKTWRLTSIRPLLCQRSIPWSSLSLFWRQRWGLVLNSEVVLVGQCEDLRSWGTWWVFMWPAGGWGTTSSGGTAYWQFGSASSVCAGNRDGDRHCDLWLVEGPATQLSDHCFQVLEGLMLEESITAIRSPHTCSRNHQGGSTNCSRVPDRHRQGFLDHSCWRLREQTTWELYC